MGVKDEIDEGLATSSLELEEDGTSAAAAPCHDPEDLDFDEDFEDEGEDAFEKNFDGDSEEGILEMMYPEGLDDNYIDDVLKEY